MKKVFSNPKRTYWRGLLAGIVAHLVTMMVVLLAYFILKPFVWFAFTNAPYHSSMEPITTDSYQWLALQGINFINWFTAGIAVGRWSQPKSWAAVVTLLACATLLPMFAAVPSTHSVTRLTIWFLGSPLAIVCGNILYRYREARLAIPARS